MDEKRMGEIALVLFKDRLKREGIRLGGIKRGLGDLSKRTGIPLSELQSFAKILIQDFLKEELE